MNDDKPWYKSKGILGALLVVMATIFNAATDYEINAEDRAELMQMIIEITQLSGGVLAFWGRITARAKIESLTAGGRNFAIALLAVGVLALPGCQVVKRGVEGSGEVAIALADVACETSIASNVDRWFWNMWRALVPFGGNAEDSCEMIADEGE